MSGRRRGRGGGGRGFELNDKANVQIGTSIADLMAPFGRHTETAETSSNKGGVCVCGSLKTGDYDNDTC